MSGPLTGPASAVQFLTRLPVPAGEYRLDAAIVWFPLVGFALGGILALVDLGLRWVPVTPLLASTALVVLLLALTGALHADGLMDAFDALFVHATPDRRLEIMRDPRSGTFGVVGMICVFALKIAALDALPLSSRPQLLVLAPGLGRWAIVLLATFFPYARQSGLGAPLKAAATPRVLVIASLLPLLGCVLLGPLGIACGLIATLSALGFGRWVTGLLHGLTGDCYGAACEIVETLVWLTAVSFSARLLV